jgi:predicted transcriptional regulator
MLKARDIGEGLCVSSRNISGALRKLVTDGFCEKMGQNPVVYTLTEKGKNFKID